MSKKTAQPKFELPKIVKRKSEEDTSDFPVPYYSYSSLAQFSTNPIIFRIKYMNNDTFDSATSASAVLGKAFHLALEVYYGKDHESQSDAIEAGLKAGMEYLDEMPQGLIEYNTKIKDMEKLGERFAFVYREYTAEKPYDAEEVLAVEECIEESINVGWNGEKLDLPVPLKGYIDRIVRDDEGRIIIKDPKTTGRVTDPDKIDGRKMLQTIEYFLLVYAHLGEQPHSMVFEEVKYTKNRDGSSQLNEYEIVFEENELFFDFYFRMYQDVTRALNGKSVFVPNINDFFDNEVAIISYVHRLDEPEQKARLMKEHQVENITELLKKELENASYFRKFKEAAEKKLQTAHKINYENMDTHEKIKTKLMEYGIVIHYVDTVQGATVDMYRFEPSFGVKMSKLQSYVADIEQVLGVSGVRVLAPVPNTSYVGFEVPREERKYPELPDTDDFQLAIGQTIDGDTYRYDIRKAPHLLIAGATGAGKSVFMASLLEQLKENSDAELHLFDPKMVELAEYSAHAVEHETEPSSILKSLERLERTMNGRYKKFAEKGVKNLEQYGGSMNYKFVFIDEFGDLTAGGALSKDIESLILRLAQKARAAGIHLILSTQRPSTDIVTGTIKANFPTKVALRTAKGTDSQVIIDTKGAEKLLGNGDMLFADHTGITRLQGFNV